MDRKNGGDPLAPPRPPKSIPGIHRPRAIEPPIMSAPLSPIQQGQPQQQQQQTHLRTNNHLHTHTHHQLNNNNGNNNVVNTSRSISRSNSNSNNNSSLLRNINNNHNSNHSSSDVLSVHPVPITAPLIPLYQQQQQQTHNISNSSLSSPTITLTNSFTRRRPLLGNDSNSNTLLPSISSNLVHSTESPASPVTLAAPRPESERLANEYVDTPLRSHHHLAPRTQHPAGHATGQVTTPHALLLLQHNERRQQQLQHSHPSHNQHSSNAINPASIPLSRPGGGGGSVGGASSLSHSNTSSSHKGSSGTTGSLRSTQTTASTTLLLPGQTTRQQSSPGVRPCTLPITKQPVSFSKDSMPASALHDEPDGHHTGVNIGGTSPNSITCPRCNRCRCEQCQSPRKLPSRWVCNKTCLCSAEAVMDYASCLCCVKALFYHCAKDKEMEGDDGDISCADDPCSCLPHKRAARWGWLGALSVVLPCLWCYWPMRGCVALCAKCYARHHRHGCRCHSSNRSESILAPISTATTISATKSADGARAGTGGMTGHHNSNSGITGSGHHHTSGTGRTIMRTTTDVTPEKRLLDSSPEY